MESFVNILLVADDHNSRNHFKSLLNEDSAHEYEITEADSFSKAAKLCVEDRPDCILVDCNKRDNKGLRFLESMQSDRRLAAISTVLLSDELNEEEAITAIKNGAHDYVLKTQLSTEKLSAVISKAIERVQLVREIEAQRIELEHLAHHDYLTDLPNRLQFEETISRELASAKRHKTELALLFIDLDDFKSINDTMGHQIGDRLLIEASNRLKKCLRSSDFIARLGGDEFAVILTDFEQNHSAGIVARKIMNMLKRPYSIDNYDMLITASIGIATYPKAGADASTLLKKADVAMYRAKETGKNHYQYHDDKLNAQHQKRLNIEHALRFAIEREQFHMLYQPKICLKTRTVIGIEALVRWQHPEMGMVSPVEFIQIAEQTGLVRPVGRWIIETAMQEFGQIHQRYSALADVKLSINLSPRQFFQYDLVQFITRCAEKYHLPMRSLDFELTETAVMSQSKALMMSIRKLHNTGASITIDDFGTGYSSLSHLKYLPISGVKIDESFISEISRDENDALIVKGIIALAKSLELKITAEGVETCEQLEFLRRNQCDYGQGYQFYKPMKFGDLVDRLAKEGEFKSAA